MSTVNSIEELLAHITVPSAEEELRTAKDRIAELEAENAELKARWADMCAGMWKVELWEKGVANDGG